MPRATQGPSLQTSLSLMPPEGWHSTISVHKHRLGPGGGKARHPDTQCGPGWPLTRKERKHLGTPYQALRTHTWQVTGAQQIPVDELGVREDMGTLQGGGGWPTPQVGGWEHRVLGMDSASPGLLGRLRGCRVWGRGAAGVSSLLLLFTPLS